ncbi:hypothetical protein ACFYXH_13615 [Streptomyces sp. NPDC002730]|uniref:hypothetical protein n=1 Tax=Streptomyces sp. NPDC002730 TaxID=3364662 RepID=UPI003699DEC6
MSAGALPQRAAAALIYQHSDVERQQEVASGLGQLVRAARQKGKEKPSGADLVQGV